MQQIVHRRPALLIEQNLGKLGTGEGILRRKLPIAVTAHQALLPDKPHRLIVPVAVALGHVAKGIVPGRFNGLDGFIAHFDFYLAAGGTAGASAARGGNGLSLLILAEGTFSVPAPRCGGGGRSISSPRSKAVVGAAALIAAGALMPAAGGVRLPPLPIAVAVHRRDGIGLPILTDAAIPVPAPRCGRGGRNVSSPLSKAVVGAAALIAAGALMPAAGGVRLPPLLIAVAVHRQNGLGLHDIAAGSAFFVPAARFGGGGRLVHNPIAGGVSGLVELMVFGAVRRFAEMPVPGAVEGPFVFRLMFGGADIQGISIGARHCGILADLNFVALGNVAVHGVKAAANVRALAALYCYRAAADGDHAACADARAVVVADGRQLANGILGLGLGVDGQAVPFAHVDAFRSLNSQPFTKIR